MVCAIDYMKGDDPLCGIHDDGFGATAKDQ